MPVYEYLCDTCGDFAVLRPMAQSGLNHDCPDCGEAAPRALLSAPAFAGMPRADRIARETNERSAHAPKESSKVDPKGTGRGAVAAGRPARPLLVRQTTAPSHFPQNDHG